MGRVGAALLFLPPLIAVILYAPAWTFLLVAEAVALTALRELFMLAERRGYRPFQKTGYLATALFAASFYPGMPGAAWIAMLLVVTAGFAALQRGHPSPETIPEVAITLLGPAYAGLLTGSLVGLRLAQPEPSGRSWVFFLLAVIMLGDTGAYYTGKAFGRRLLAPALSPKKTMEGLYGGIVTSLAVALILGPLLIPQLPLLHAGGLGIALALLGVAGDLFESLLKRSVEVKDAGSLIPGHGGILDRLDSLLFSAPLLLLYVRFAHAI